MVEKLAASAMPETCLHQPQGEAIKFFDNQWRIRCYRSQIATQSAKMKRGRVSA